MVIISPILERDEEHGDTLWNTAVKAQALYGAEALGIAPTTCRTLRSSLASQVGAKPGGPEGKVWEGG